MVIDGCKYRINRRSGQTVYWRCFFRWCRANAVVEAGKLKSSCGVHICSQPLKGRHQSTHSDAAAVKMATRANQLTSSAAVKTKKAATNNNMVVQRKATKPANVKLNGQKSEKSEKGDRNRTPVLPPPPPPPTADNSVKSEDLNSTKQVRNQSMHLCVCPCIFCLFYCGIGSCVPPTVVTKQRESAPLPMFHALPISHCNGP